MSVLSPVVAITWVLSLLFGWRTDSSTLFYAIYSTLVLCPSIAAIAFAFAGRNKSDNRNLVYKLANSIGTVGFLIVGFTGCLAYGIAVYYKPFF